MYQTRPYYYTISIPYKNPHEHVVWCSLTRAVVVDHTASRCSILKDAAFHAHAVVHHTPAAVSTKIYIGADRRRRRTRYFFYGSSFRTHAVVHENSQPLCGMNKNQLVVVVHVMFKDGWC